MTANRFITLAIHTYPHAVHLKKILESHGITARLENIGDSTTPVEVGLRVKIAAKDLPMALKIVESGDSYSQLAIERKLTGLTNNVLIPVDFSDHSNLSVTIGFALAERLGLNVTLLHTFASPYFSDGFGNVSDPSGLESGDDGVSEVEEIQATSAIERESKRQMKKFADKISDKISAGELPDIHFSTFVEEGLPEEVILEYTRATPPAVVVMATRGKSRKEEELIGSVTAEVLDTCRVPILAVPEDYKFISIADIQKLVFFCNLNQNDLLSVDTLMRMFSYPDVDITLVPVSQKTSAEAIKKIADLQEYFSANYPTGQFHTANVPTGNDFRAHMENLIRDKHIEMLVVPNKKKNIFSRLFNPGIAHRILFEKDIPILALPV